MKKIILLSLLAISSLLTSAQEDPLWMRYPAISPDGSQILFNYMGDIWKVPVRGGAAVPMTLHNAHDHMPVWSHDGSQIAFSSNRYGNFDVFVMSANGGEPTRLTHHSASDYPSDFSPDNSSVLFTSSRLDDADNQQFPTGALPELYSVPASGGRVDQVLTTPAHDAKYSDDGNTIIFHDRKGYESDWRKHHTSSVTRDVWSYDVASGNYTQLSKFNGEDRNPVFSSDNDFIYYLTESSGSLNIHKMGVDGSGNAPVTKLTNHPVRHLSISDSGLLCYTYNGEIYTMREGDAPIKVRITIGADARENPVKTITASGNLSDLAVSPNGKEIAFVYRGEVFAASVKEGTTKRITNTPEQERTVSFSPDGRSILYASERNGSWNIYESSISREDEKYFFVSTLIDEEAVIEGPAEMFQPAYSPDGKEVAYLEERTALKVVNLESKAVREILPANMNYSYADGDQHFDWSPDGKWFLVNFLNGEQWIEQSGIIKSDGTGEVFNLSESGYGAYGPTWMMDGQLVIWFSWRHGMKSHGSWGSQADVYGVFLTQEAYDEFKLNEEEYELFQDESDDEDEEEEDDEKDKKKKKKGDDEEEEDSLEPIEIDFDNLEDRRVRLTNYSSFLSDAYVSNDGTKLFYLTRYEKDFDLWQKDIKTRETKVLAKLGSGAGEIVPDKEGKNLFIHSRKGITKVDVGSGETKGISVKGEMTLDEKGEREYLFEHVWRQVKKKFYVEDLHGVDWDMYKTEYAKFLPHINNNYDFAEMMSELLGELNASHTGAYFGSGIPNGDATASLGLFYDNDYTGDGLKIEEVMDKSPVIKKDSKIKAGVIIEKIDGNDITASVNHYQYLNRKSGKNTLLSLYDPATKERWEEVVKPISFGMEYELRYQRWRENCRNIVEEASGGKVGYVHVRGMNDNSFRVVYDEVLGKNAHKDALIVDTRFNGGGWLHDDLATFLNGEQYMTFLPRGQNLGGEPHYKWKKPSIVVMSESNYSDAHMFPVTYRALGIGKLLGMPVPGTGTAVWWEPLQNGVVFGIPQVGMLDNDGNLLENTQLEPDIRVPNDPGVVITGRDQQLEEAVKELMK